MCIKKFRIIALFSSLLLFSGTKVPAQDIEQAQTESYGQSFDQDLVPEKTEMGSINLLFEAPFADKERTIPYYMGVQQSQRNLKSFASEAEQTNKEVLRMIFLKPMNILVSNPYFEKFQDGSKNPLRFLQGVSSLDEVKTFQTSEGILVYKPEINLKLYDEGLEADFRKHLSKMSPKLGGSDISKWPILQVKLAALDMRTGTPSVIGISNSGLMTRSRKIAEFTFSLNRNEWNTFVDATLRGEMRFAIWYKTTSRVEKSSRTIQNFNAQTKAIIEKELDKHNIGTDQVILLHDAGKISSMIKAQITSNTYTTDINLSSKIADQNDLTSYLFTEKQITIENANQDPQLLAQVTAALSPVLQTVSSAYGVNFLNVDGTEITNTNSQSSGTAKSTGEETTLGIKGGMMFSPSAAGTGTPGGGDKGYLEGFGMYKNNRSRTKTNETQNVNEARNLLRNQYGVEVRKVEGKNFYTPTTIKTFSRKEASSEINITRFNELVFSSAAEYVWHEDDNIPQWLMDDIVEKFDFGSNSLR